MNEPFDTSEDGLLSLAEVLARLGNEFRRASEVDEPVLDWYGATVELEAVVERGGDGRLRFWVLEGGGQATSRSTVRVSVNIAPHGQDRMAGGM